jgi:uncharacterized membrane protein
MAATAQLSPRTRAFILGVDRVILHIARRWLAVTNGMSALFAGLPLLAPWLLANDHHGLANAIYFVYMPVCHQRPERSFFPFGEQMAFCQRDTAIYTSLLLAGLAYILIRRHLRPLRWSRFFLLITPMAIDGFTQLFGLRESTWELRVITGTLFGIASVWLLYPHLQIGMAEMVDTLEERFRRLAAREATFAASAAAEAR